MTNGNSVVGLLTSLKDIGCRIWVEDGELMVRTSKAGITEELKEQLKSNREKILAYLDSLQVRDIRLADGIPVLPIGSPLVISHAQQRLWFLAQLEGISATYNIPSALRLNGPLNVEILRQTFRVLIERHQTLRLCFPTVDGEGTVREIPIYDPLTVTDFSHLQETQQQTEIQQQLQTHATRPFDLAEGKLLRLHLLILNSREHVLLFDMHHIISDGWSMGVLEREWGEVYSALLQGQTPDLDPLPIQYSDYAAWQRDWLQGDVLQRKFDYWTKQLADVPELLALPTDFPRPAMQSYRGNYLQTHIGPELTSHLNRFSQQQNSTLFMTLLAAFDVLLARYSGQDDICVGSPTANRTHPDTENLIGFFVNTLVLRTRLNPDQSFRELLQQVRQTCLGAYAHQDIPFETLVEQLNPTRSLSHSPLFQVMLALQNNAPAEMEWPGLSITALAQDYPIAKFDLTLNVEEQDGQLYCAWEYATSLFTEQTIRRMGEHFEVLLRGIVEDPERPVSRLPLLSEAERRRILVEWNDTGAPYPQEQCVHELFEERVAKTPDAVAIVFEDEEISYGELNMRANRLAHRLRKLGVGPEVLVGLFVERSVEMVVGLLAILKAGGAYVPLDPEYPAERLAFMAEDADLHVLLCHETTRERVPECAAYILDVDAEAEEIARESSENPARLARSSNLAYVIYTSGSTGKPKGVMVEHRNISAMLHGFEYLASSGEALIGTSVTPSSFDVSVWEIFSNLCFGGALHVLRREQFANPEDFSNYLIGNRVTCTYIPPALLSDLVAQLDKQDDPIALNRILVGVEPIKQGVLQRFRDISRDMSIINGYGPTETTICATFFDFREAIDPERRTPIGTAVANYRIFLTDSNLQPVPIGVPGELYIGGAGVARGYLNRPELTAERFIPDPFSDAPNARLYRTGDLCRYLPDGTIEYLGRIDTQVKIRGFRIELGEVENALLAHPDVREAVVDARGEGVDKQLVAWVGWGELGNPNEGVSIPDSVGVRSSPQPTNELRAHLRASLPDWMVPARFVFVDTLPLTPSGKIDRRALPAPEATDSPGTEYIAPISPTEELLAQLWSAVLKRETIGRFDNFFDLGGHSLLATQLISRVRDSLQVELPVRVVFEHPELSALAGAIESSSGLSSQLPPIEPQPTDAPKVLSFAQQRLWFLDRFETSGTATYNIPTAVRLSGALDIHALQASLQWMVERHESLRMAFPERDGEAGVVVLSADDFEFLVRDLRDPSLAGQPLQQCINEHAARPFDLARGPLFRAEILQLAEEDGQPEDGQAKDRQTVHVLLINMHHIISDGWSMGVFVREWRHAYIAFAEGHRPTLAPLPIQYGDYAHWQRQWLQGGILEQQSDYWREALEGIPERLELPTDYPRPAQQSYQGAHHLQVLPSDVTMAIRDLSRAQGVTLFMTLLAAFDILLSRYSGQDDICVGSPIANRTHTHTENLIGFFVNTLVLRTRLNPDQGFRALLEQVRQTCLGAYAHQDIPFETLVEQLNPARTLSHSPLFQVMLAVQNNAPVEMELPGVTIDSLEQDYPIAKFDLTLNIVEQDGQLYCAWEYATSLFTIDTIRRMGEHFQVLLRGIVEDPERPVSQLPLLTEAERHRILVEWNDTQMPYPQDKCIHELFEAQVAKTPDAVAVVFEDEEVSYFDLNARANRLAHRLRKLDVGPEVLVGLFVERSVEMVEGILAILKAGGAYVPLDPEYPEERLAFMSDDADLKVLLCHGATRERVPECAARILDMDEDAQGIAGENSENPAQLAEPDNLAYVIYTSGSTGKPKGVAIEHRNTVALLHWGANHYSREELSGVLAATSVCFDLSIYEVYLPLSVGGAIVVVEDALSLAEFKNSDRVTLVNTVPSAIKELLDAGDIPASVKTINLAGEPLSQDVVDRLYSLETVDKVFDLYGPSEDTTYSTYALRQQHGSPTIGRPVSNTQAYILDVSLYPVPVGIPGELYIGGAGLARGYLNRPDLTAERFIPDPFSDDAISDGIGARLYRTGDLCRWLPDGNIEYLGRIDTQVKIRGFRIECGEVENALLSHPDVREAVVDARGEGMDKQLVAWLCAARGNDADVWATGRSSIRDELRAHLRASLPDWMVPSVFVFVDTLPLTPSGKINRRALPAPDASDSPGTEYIAPISPTEELLAGLWSAVLKRESVGRFDNFFDLGGHSLLATQVVSRVRTEFGMEIPVRALFEYPTIKEIADYISANFLSMESEDVLLQENEGVLQQNREEFEI
uniref:Amino acid adenylation domain-containing protein n=1 Tax=Candidatus Kentrum sp. FW TaxID=2126338 RepID=A0A450TZ74_9GAMM|nr:MAG: amino acid adenylation domain-containing protein [Candidatus Kentron sp. FW]